MRNQFHTIIILFIVLLLPYVVKAQTNYEDVVYLKNGSIIHGMVIELVPNQSIKIMTKDENVFVCKMDEIEKITKEEIETPSTILYNKIKKHGYMNITEAGIGTGTGNSTGVETINGYLFKPMISLGLGTGIDIDKSNNLALIPLFVDLRAYMLDKVVSPYMSAAAGYSFNADNSNTKGGRLINIAFGVRAYLSSKSAILFSLGYRLQTATYTFISYNNQRLSDKEYLGYINFKLGFMF